MTSGVTSSSPMQPSQSSSVQTDRPRDADAASKFKDSLSSKSDSSDSVSSRDTSDTMPRMDDSLRSQGEMRSSYREQGRVDSDGGRGSQGHDKGSDDKGGRDSKGHGDTSLRVHDPRMAPHGMGPHGPKPGAKHAGPTLGKGLKGHSPPPTPGELSRGMVKTGAMLKRPPGSSVRGTSPFAGKPLASILGSHQKPALRQTRAMGSRGMPAHRLLPEAGLRDPRFRGGIVTHDNAPKHAGVPLRTPPPSAGAPCLEPMRRSAPERGCRIFP